MAGCASCGLELTQGQEVTIKGKTKNDPHLTLCQECAAGIEQVFEAETAEPNLAGGLGLGLLMAAVSGLLWYGIVVLTKYEVGYAAVAVGLLVAFGVRRGSGNKRGALLQAFSVIITLLAMAASEYFIIRHFVAEAMLAEGYVVPLLLPFDLAAKMISASISDNPMTLFFWAIAVWIAYQGLAKRKLNKVI